MFFYHLDHRGAPTAITDSEGSVVWKGEYFPFGDLVDETVEGPLKPRRQLQTSYVDQDLSLDGAGDAGDSAFIYMGARHYDSEIGRFYS